jgi:arylsulfatase A-like enzyme
MSAPAMYYASARERITESSDNLSSRLWTWLERSYRDAIRSTDAFLDALQTELGSDDPVFVVHADHGEAFGEHGTYGHEEALYEENLHVPLVVTNVANNETVETPVSLRTLPWLIEQVATDGPVNRETITRDHVVATTEGVQGQRRAIRSRRWKYITDGERRELYDLRSDPNETTDLAGDRTEFVDELDRLLHLRLRRATEVVEIGRAIDAIDLHELQRQGVSR